MPPFPNWAPHNQQGNALGLGRECAGWAAAVEAAWRSCQSYGRKRMSVGPNCIIETSLLGSTNQSSIHGLSSCGSAWGQIPKTKTQKHLCPREPRGRSHPGAPGECSTGSLKHHPAQGHPPGPGAQAIIKPFGQMKASEDSRSSGSCLQAPA